jgi:hypothetical protein
MIGAGPRGVVRWPIREPPDDLSQDMLGAGLRAHYGLAVTAVTFLPLGQVSSAWVYRVRTADDAAYFLKVRKSVANVPGLLVPRFLQDHGGAPVVAPLPTTMGALWAEVAGYALILYPFIAGITGMAHGMAPSQWIAYGAILRQIHTTPITAELAHCLQRETFVPAGAATVRAVDAHLGGPTLADPVVQDFVTLWHERWDTVHILVARAEELGQRLAHRAPLACSATRTSTPATRCDPRCTYPLLWMARRRMWRRNYGRCAHRHSYVPCLGPSRGDVQLCVTDVDGPALRVRAVARTRSYIGIAAVQ